MSNRETIHKYFEALNHENWQELGELFHSEASYKATGARERKGRDEITSFFSTLFSPWLTHNDGPTRLILDGDAAAAEVTFTGTTQDGRTVSFDAVDVFTFHDGKLMTASTWYDLPAVRRLLESTAGG